MWVIKGDTGMTMVQVYQSSSSFSTGLLATRQLEVQASGALGTWVSD